MKARNEQRDTETPAEQCAGWLDRHAISQQRGALKPSAYVARAYNFEKAHGRLPEWARKIDGGKWLFAEAYISEDAALQIETMGISDAAALVGTSRRTIQTWVDEGLLETAGENRQTGESRRVNRAALMRALPELKARLDKSGATADSDAQPAMPGGANLSSLRKRLAVAQKRRADVLKDVRTAQRAADGQQGAITRSASRIEKLRRQFEARLRDLEKVCSYAKKKQGTESARAQKLVKKAEAIAELETELSQAIEVEAASQKRLQAQALARRLDEARLPSATGPADVGRVQRAAKQVSESHGSRNSDALFDAAVTMAAALSIKVEAGQCDRIDAAIRFYNQATAQGIPNDIIVDVTQSHFARD
jgi:excisionase family DNA binding protein